jgi:hypothetical protein
MLLLPGMQSVNGGVAMDSRTYKKTTEKEFIGRKVISLLPMSNGLYRFPAGITWTIKRKHSGFELLSDPCPHCGIQAAISKVGYWEVDFTDQRSLWPAPEVKSIQFRNSN